MKKEKQGDLCALPAVASAVAWLQQRLGDLWQPGDRLPALGRLSAGAGVSRVSMHKALHYLAQRNQIRIIGRSGTFIPDTGPLTPPEIRKDTPLHAQLYHDIIAGAFRLARTLPSTKQLCARYRVSYPTMRKALTELINRQVLVKNGHSYNIQRYITAPRRAGATILFATWEPLWQVGAGNFTGLSMASFLASIERECTLRNLTLKKVTFQELLTQLPLYRREPVLGCILYFPRKHIQKLLSGLGACPFPLAVMDDYPMGCHQGLLEGVRLPYLGLFSLDEMYAGRVVGEAIRNQGHRGCVFFSPFSREAFSQKRYEGLCAAFSAGLQSPPPRFLGTPAYKKQLHYRFLHRLESLSQASVFARTQLAHSAQQKVPAVLDEYIDTPRKDWVTEQDFWYLQFDHLYKAELWFSLEPFFQQALSLPEATAWVGANDGVALAAQNFLNKHRHRSIALYGFDNTAEATFHSLSSYSFEIEAGAVRMLDWLLKRPERKAGPAQAEYISLQGILMAR